MQLPPGNWSAPPGGNRDDAEVKEKRGAITRRVRAAGEFQKILDHRGFVTGDPIGPLTRVQLTRAHAMQGDTAKAKTFYQDFLTLWMPTPDILILKQAKAEYTKRP